jgi:YD repeat-containing protein
VGVFRLLHLLIDIRDAAFFGAGKEEKGTQLFSGATARWAAAYRHSHRAVREVNSFVAAATTGVTTSYTYDALNRHVAVTDPLGKVSTTAYLCRTKLWSHVFPN